MTRKDLFQQIQQKKSYLCVGLDADYSRIPKHLLKYDDPVFEFNKQIIDATKDLCVSRKKRTKLWVDESKTTCLLQFNASNCSLVRNRHHCIWYGHHESISPTNIAWRKLYNRRDRRKPIDGRQSRCWCCWYRCRRRHRPSSRAGTEGTTA